jgi:hypothetical protein
MRRFISLSILLFAWTWGASSSGEESESPPVAPPGEGTEAPPPGIEDPFAGEPGPSEAPPEAQPPAPAEPTAPAEGTPTAPPAEETPTAPPAEGTPPAAQPEALPPPPIEAAAPELAEEEEEAAESEEAAGAAEGEEERHRVGSEQQYTNALPFRNTVLIYENIFSVAQLDRGYQQTYNPYYAMSLSLQPRWYFTDELSIRLRFDIEGELTDADDTSNYHETRVSDLYLDLVYNPIYTIPRLDLGIGLGLRALFPTSLESQAESRYVGLSPDLRLARVFDVLDGLTISYQFRYTKYLNRYTTMQRDTNPYECTGDDPGCMANWQLGDPARSHGFSNWIQLDLEFLSEQWRPMTFSVSVIFLNYLTYEVPEAEVELMGGQTVSVDHIEDPVNHVAFIWYTFELGLDITDYLSVAIGASTYNPQLAADSTYREPFFNRYTRIYVDLSLDVERVVAAIRR